ncbi:hypothetical protein N665_1443s0005 [Sinapis alba]|nr:hypothetical protein N665_1443s0005 [Sinapis alba]
MDAYFGVTKSLAAEFNYFELTKVPRKDKCFTDALAALGSNQRYQVRGSIPIHTVEKPSITLPEGKDVLAISSNITEITSLAENGEDWLHQWIANKLLLTCVGKEEAELVMIKTHEGEGGNHGGGRSLALKLKSQSYYWPTMVNDCEEYASRCDKYQRHAPYIHCPTKLLKT